VCQQTDELTVSTSPIKPNWHTHRNPNFFPFTRSRHGRPRHAATLAHAVAERELAGDRVVPRAARAAVRQRVRGAGCLAALLLCGRRPPPLLLPRPPVTRQLVGRGENLKNPKQHPAMEAVDLAKLMKENRIWFTSTVAAWAAALLVL
jgi:hypothetical protein